MRLGQKTINRENISNSKWREIADGIRYKLYETRVRLKNQQGSKGDWKWVEAEIERSKGRTNAKGRRVQARKEVTEP